MTREEATIDSLISRFEALDKIKEKKVIKMRDATPEERESIDKYIKSISTTGVYFCDLEPCEDVVSRQAVFDALNSINGTSELDKAFEVIEKLQSVTPKGVTVTDFADRRRECGKEKVHDKIRAEIEAIEDGISSYHNDRPWIFKDEALAIIDKYKAEMESEK